MKQKKVTIGNIEYTLQHPGIGWYLDTTSNATTANGIPHQGMLYRAYLEHVVVDPKKNIEDFDNMEDGFSHLQKLVGECERFLRNQK